MVDQSKALQLDLIENPAHNINGFKGLWDYIYIYILFCECDSEETLKMQNEEGQITELYIPRKWYNISGYFDCYLVMEFEKRVFGFVSVLLQID